MNLFEAGVIAGTPAGAVVGGVIGQSHGTIGIVGGSFAGVVPGALAGYLYAWVVLFFMSFIGVLWRAARKRPDELPQDTEMDVMTKIANRGIFMAVATSLVLFIFAGWLHALVVTIVAALVMAFVAVARCELRRAG